MTSIKIIKRAKNEIQISELSPMRIELRPRARTGQEEKADNWPGIRLFQQTI